MAVQTQKPLEEYMQILRQTEYQDAYNEQLKLLGAEPSPTEISVASVLL